MLNQTVAQQIIKNIRLNHAFNAEVSIRFVTDTTVGYIPKKHLETYLDGSDFRFANGELRFSPHVQGFDLKTKAVQSATNRLIQNRLIVESREPHFQERAVGGDDRITSPKNAEFKINRAYFRYYGFQADGVFLNVVINNPTVGDSYVLLQQRAARVEAGNAFDFAAGGAIKFPQTVSQALNKQVLEELGADVSTVEYQGSTSFKFSTENKDWVTSIRHNIFSLQTRAFGVGDFDRQEVQGFKLFTVEETLAYCADGRISQQNVQSYLTSIYKMNLLPDFDGVNLIKSELDKHFIPPQSVERRMSLT